MLRVELDGARHRGDESITIAFLERSDTKKVVSLRKLRADIGRLGQILRHPLEQVDRLGLATGSRHDTGQSQDRLAVLPERQLQRLAKRAFSVGIPSGRLLRQTERAIGDRYAVVAPDDVLKDLHRLVVAPLLCEDPRETYPRAGQTRCDRQRARVVNERLVRASR